MAASASKQLGKQHPVCRQSVKR